MYSCLGALSFTNKPVGLKSSNKLQTDLKSNFDEFSYELYIDYINRSYVGQILLTKKSVSPY